MAHCRRARQLVRPQLQVRQAQQQVLEIILGLAQKVMSNYINHVAETPVDEPFQRFAWEKSGAKAA